MLKNSKNITWTAIGGNCPGLIVRGSVILSGNFPGGNCRGAIFWGAIIQKKIVLEPAQID